MTDNRILTRSDLLVTEPTALEDFARATAFSALQQPLSGVAQLVDKTTGKTEHLKNAQFIEPASEAKFGTARWHAQTAGGAIGTLLPFAASLYMSKRVLGRTAAQSTLAAETGLGITLTEAACAGFINDSLFRPVDPNKNFVKERLLNGGIGAVNFTMLTATGLGLGKLGEHRTLSFLRNPISTGVISGIPAGALGANLESIREHGKLASGADTLKSIYQMSFAGGALGAKQKLFGTSDLPARTDSQGQAETSTLRVVLRTPDPATIPAETVSPVRVKGVSAERADTPPPPQAKPEPDLLPRRGDTAIIPLEATQRPAGSVSSENTGPSAPRTNPDSATGRLTADGTGSVVLRPAETRPVDSVSAEKALQNRPPETVAVPPQRKGPPPIPKETDLPLAEPQVEARPVREPRPKRDAPPEKRPAKVEKTEPPAEGFYTKETNYQGIPIRAAECVSDQALLEAHRRIEMMLENAPEVVEKLYENGAEFYVIGKNQEVSDLPALRHWKGKPYDGELTIDKRTRGVGGYKFSCAGEENLLKLPGDRYVGRDITVHEFTHTVHKYGLTAEVMERIKTRFEEAKAEGKWPGAYAIKNDMEYFAELSMWYFGSRGDYGTISPSPLPGREWLRTYDPKGYELVESIYRKPGNGPTEISPILAPVPAEITGLKSLTGGAPIRLVIQNEGSKPASVYWVTGEGKLQAYTTIQPNGTLSQATYTGHYWKIGDHYYAAHTKAVTARVFIK